MKAIILARVSTEEQISEGHSIPAQLDKARQYCLHKKLDIKSEHQFDESSLKDVRSKFEIVVSEIKKSKTKIVLIVETIDRLQRSFKESVLLDQFRKEDKLEIHFLRENLIIHKDSNSSEIQRWDLGVFLAKSYVLQISDNVKRSFAEKLKNGEFPGLAPFGYVNLRDENDKSIIEPHKLDSKIVQKIFEYYASGAYSMKQVRDKIRSEFHKKLLTSRVEAILQNGFYFGQMTVKGRIYPHKHPTLISKQLFDEAQTIRLGRSKKPFKFKGVPFPYRGLIRCATCKCAITPIKKRKKSGLEYVYYKCSEYHGKHGAEYVREERLTEQFTKYFDKIHIPEKIVKEALATLKTSHKAKKDYYHDINDGLKEADDKLERRLEKMYEDKLDGLISEEEYKKRSTKYRIEQKAIRQKLSRLHESDEHYYVKSNYLLNIANKAPQIFQSSKVEVKRQLINLVLWNPTLNGTTLSATYRKPFDLLAKGPSNHIWGLLLDKSRICQPQRVQLVIAFHRRRCGKLEASLDLPFPERPKKEPPVNAIQQALAVKAFMVANPDHTCLSAAGPLNMHRKRIAKLLKILDTLPADFIKQFKDCRDPRILHRLSVNHLYQIASGRSPNRIIKELNSSTSCQS